MDTIRSEWNTLDRRLYTFVCLILIATVHE